MSGIDIRQDIPKGFKVAFGYFIDARSILSASTTKLCGNLVCASGIVFRRPYTYLILVRLARYFGEYGMCPPRVLVCKFIAQHTADSARPGFVWQCDHGGVVVGSIRLNAQALRHILGVAFSKGFKYLGLSVDEVERALILRGDAIKVSGGVVEVGFVAAIAVVVHGGTQLAE